MVTMSVFLGVAFFAAFLFTWLLRRFALTRNLVDIPNSRSSHVLPTPRGGGVAIVLVVLGGLPLLWWQGNIAGTVWAAFAGAGGMVALVGWFDDQGHIAASRRLLVHFTAAVWGLVYLGGMPSLAFAGQTVSLGWLGHGLAVVYLVWLLNLYNFMDGIDGIACIEAITVCGSGVMLYWLTGVSAGWEIPLLLVAAVLGFLCWNFPRAWIFMGDAGSGFVGLVLGLLSLQAGWHNPELLWCWLILLGAFVTDATVTLLRRLFSGQRVSEAHRSHAYQHAAILHGSHIPVTLAFAAINLGWLLPMAVLVATARLDGLAGVLLAYIPLIILALYYRAGTDWRKDVV